MNDRPNSKKSRNKSSTRLKKSAQPGILKKKGPGKISDAENSGAPPLSGLLNDLKEAVAGSALRVAAKAGGASLTVGTALLIKPEHRKIIREAGRSIKGLRELAGRTRNEVCDALGLKDTSLLKALEDGTAALSFELILKLTALHARHDPIPFIIKYARTFNPALWNLLDDREVGRPPLYIEREREFVYVYRNHDMARARYDKEFKKLLAFTRAALEMALNSNSNK